MTRHKTLCKLKKDFNLIKVESNSFADSLNDSDRIFRERQLRDYQINVISNLHLILFSSYIIPAVYWI